MGNYIEGFSDAVEIFEESINNALKGNKSKEEIINKIISTLYIAKFRLDTIEDEYISDLEQQYEEHIAIEYEKIDLCEILCDLLRSEM